jgi:hypothetical protein
MSIMIAKKIEDYIAEVNKVSHVHIKVNELKKLVVGDQ